MRRDQILEQLASLPDESLVHELRCAQRYASCTTRTRRDLALMCVRCLREELERRHTRQLSPTSLPERSGDVQPASTIEGP